MAPTTKERRNDVIALLFLLTAWGAILGYLMGTATYRTHEYFAQEVCTPQPKKPTTHQERFVKALVDGSSTHD